jgi:hypothetical protein
LFQISFYHQLNVFYVAGQIRQIRTGDDIKKLEPIIIIEEEKAQQSTYSLDSILNNDNDVCNALYYTLPTFPTFPTFMTFPTFATFPTSSHLSYLNVAELY